MKQIYTCAIKILRSSLPIGAVVIAMNMQAQNPTTVTNGVCDAVVADFNTSDNGFNSPSIYDGNIFAASFYYNASRGYWTDYLPPTNVNAPAANRVMSIISPPFTNPNPNGTFNVGFTYIVPNPAIDQFQIRIVSLTQTPQGLVPNIEAATGLLSFSTNSTGAPQPYVDNETALMDGFSGTVCVRLIDPDIINNSNTTFRIEIAYSIPESFFAALDNLSIGPSQSPLPVNFIGLVAKRNGSNVDLKWDVGEEMDLKEYQVEKSTNGSSFTSAGYVLPKGKSIYAFTDYNVPANTIFYRIKGVDIDGKFKYSGIIRLKADALNSYGNKLTLYPSLATDQVTVEHKKLNAGARMTITATDGRILKIIVPTDGSSHTPVDISSFRSGIYILRLNDGEGNIETAKFVKQ